MELPFDDEQDFEDARRGRVGSLTDPVIQATSGPHRMGRRRLFASSTASARRASTRASGARAG